MARTATTKKTDSNSKTAPVVPLKKSRAKRWWNKKLKLWQALLMALGAVWIFWIFWVIDFIEGQI